MSAETTAPAAPIAAAAPQAPGGWRPVLITAAILFIAAGIGLAISGKWNVLYTSGSSQSTDDAVLRSDVAVDGVPGVVFKGRVDTISPATGSALSLIPPDNATGNFTKSAQRIPVKITLDSGQPQPDRLRSGMSVVATVHPGR